MKTKVSVFHAIVLLLSHTCLAYAAELQGSPGVCGGTVSKIVGTGRISWSEIATDSRTVRESRALQVATADYESQVSVLRKACNNISRVPSGIDGVSFAVDTSFQEYFYPNEYKFRKVTRSALVTCHCKFNLKDETTSQYCGNTPTSESGKGLTFKQVNITTSENGEHAITYIAPDANSSAAADIRSIGSARSPDIDSTISRFRDYARRLEQNYKWECSEADGRSGWISVILGTGFYGKSSDDNNILADSTTLRTSMSHLCCFKPQNESEDTVSTEYEEKERFSVDSTTLPIETLSE